LPGGRSGKERKKPGFLKKPGFFPVTCPDRIQSCPTKAVKSAGEWLMTGEVRQLLKEILER